VAADEPRVINPLEYTLIREQVPPAAWETVFLESTYYPRTSEGWTGAGIPPQVVGEVEELPSLEWLRSRIALWKGEAELQRQLIYQASHGLGQAPGVPLGLQTAQSKQRHFLWDYYKTSVAGEILVELGLAQGLWGLPRFNLAALDVRKLPAWERPGRPHIFPWYWLQQFFQGKSCVTPDPNTDLVTIINTSGGTQEWTLLAQAVQALHTGNKNAALGAPDYNYRYVRQLSATFRRFWQTVCRWEMIFQPYPGVSLWMQETWPVEQQIRYAEKFEEMKSLQDLLGARWSAPIPWPVPMHPTEEDALAHLVEDVTGQAMEYETTWPAMIDEWYTLDSPSAASSEKVPSTGDFDVALAAIAAGPQKTVDTATSERYIWWTVALSVLGVVAVWRTS